MRDGKFKGKFIRFDSIESNNNRVVFTRKTGSEDNDGEEIWELLRSVRVGTIVDLETRDCRLRVLLIDGTSREETTRDRDKSYS